VLGFFAVSLAHAAWRLGRCHALAFLTIVFVTSVAAEVVGLVTGLVFGPYYYTDRLGWKLFGLVPIAVPVGWFVMTYASYSLAEALAGARPGPGRGTRWRVARPAVAALAMTSWDLALDPVMAFQSHWVWVDGGDYFGVPARNFAGWFGTVLAMCLFYELFERWIPARRRGGATAWVPVGVYAVCGAATVTLALVHGQLESAAFGFTLMGGLLAAVAVRQLVAPAGFPRQAEAVPVSTG
jgi:putative membrane protein